MTYRIALAAAAMAAALLPGVSQAQGVPANTAKNVHLRAGPARDYPVVAILPAGYPITVEGCLPGYTWCDVVAGPSRGWVYAGNINYYYQGQWVPVPSYAPLIGIVVLGFILDDYWSHYYYDRPWYAERHRWINRPPPPPLRHRPPGALPLPPHVAPPPPAGPRPSPAVPLRPRPAPGATLPGVHPVPQPRAEQRQERKAEREQAREKR